MANTFATKPGSAAVLNYGSAYPFNDAAYVNPSANLGGFKWHSGLYYLGCNQILTGTIQLNYNTGGWSSFSLGEPVHTIAYHGKGYRPIILGFLTINGIPEPINGNTIFSGVGTVAGATAVVSLNVFADASNVYIRQTSMVQGYIASSHVIGYTLYVCNIGDNGGLVLPPYYAGVRASPTQFRAGYFDPQTYQYFYRSGSGNILLYKGPSLSVDVGSYPSSSSYFMLGARQDINGYSNSALRTSSAFDTSPWNRTWPGTPVVSPSVERVAATGIGNSGLVIQPGYTGLGTGFNTNQNTLLISNYVPATLNIPAYSTSGGGIYRTDVFDLGACHPNCTVMLGTYTINGETYSVGGTNYSKLGTLRMGPSQSYTINSTGFVLPAVGQTFYIDNQGGRVKATVRSFCPRGITANLTASSIAFKVLTGTFDY